MTSLQACATRAAASLPSTHAQTSLPTSLATRSATTSIAASLAISAFRASPATSACGIRTASICRHALWARFDRPIRGGHATAARYVLITSRLPASVAKGTRSPRRFRPILRLGTRLVYPSTKSLISVTSLAGLTRHLAQRHGPLPALPVAHPMPGHESARPQAAGHGRPRRRSSRPGRPRRSRA